MKGIRLVLCATALYAAEPPAPPLPNVQSVIVVSTNLAICPPAQFCFTNLTGKTALETSTNLTNWDRVLSWPSNEFQDITIQIDKPTNKCVYWRLVP